MSKKDYIKQIVKILLSINDIWVLNQIYRCVVNITKEDTKWWTIKKEIIAMLEKIDNERFLKMIYGFVSHFCR